MHESGIQNQHLQVFNGCFMTTLIELEQYDVDLGKIGICSSVEASGNVAESAKPVGAVGRSSLGEYS